MSWRGKVKFQMFVGPCVFIEDGDSILSWPHTHLRGRRRTQKESKELRKRIAQNFDTYGDLQDYKQKVIEELRRGCKVQGWEDTLSHFKIADGGMFPSDTEKTTPYPSDKDFAHPLGNFILTEYSTELRDKEWLGGEDYVKYIALYPREPKGSGRKIAEQIAEDQSDIISTLEFEGYDLQPWEIYSTFTTQTELGLQRYK